MSKKRVGIGSISLLLVIIALIWNYNIFGFCLGDKVLSMLHLPAWSNGNNGQGIHYTVYYSLLFFLPALALAIKNKNHLFTTTGKWLAIIFIVLLLVSPLLVMI